MKPNGSRVTKPSSRMVGRWGVLALTGLLLAAPAMAVGSGWSSGVRPSRAQAPLPGDLSFLGGRVGVLAPSSAGDPRGDLLGGGSDTVDILGIAVTATPDSLVIDITFGSPITAPDSGQANALDGFIDIDADQNGATGDLPWTDFEQGIETTGMGNEFFVDLFTYNGGDRAADVVNDLTETVVGRAPVSFTALSMSVRIPLTFFGGDSNVNVAAVIGTLAGADDVVPNLGSVASTPGPAVEPPCIARTTSDTRACVPSETTLCLNNDRFAVSAMWATFEGEGEGGAIPLRDDSGLFYFFDPDNAELTVKVLNACTVNGRYWLFASGLTNVGVALEVRDTRSGRTVVCRNPLGSAFQPIQDVRAFPTCP